MQFVLDKRSRLCAPVVPVKALAATYGLDTCESITIHSYILHLAPPPTPLQVAGRTNDSAGDGTTTAAVLAREMIHFGLMAVTSGANPIAVKKGIDKTQEYLVGKLKENAKPVQGRNDIRVSGGRGGV